MIYGSVTYTDALAAARGGTITRTTSEGYRMVGFRDGSIDVWKGWRRVKELPEGTGPALGYPDWQVEGQP